MKLLVIVVALLLTHTGAQSQEKNELKNKATMTNKEKAEAINKAVQKADLHTAEELVKKNYIQHTPMVPDGKNGLLVLLGKIKKRGSACTCY
jgi:nitrate reductase cytochrome c-type subunit